MPLPADITGHWGIVVAAEIRATVDYRVMLANNVAVDTEVMSVRIKVMGREGNATEGKIKITVEVDG